jgi:hypothetical protein
MLETLAIFGNVQPQLQPHLSIHPIASGAFPRVEFERNLERTLKTLGGTERLRDEVVRGAGWLRSEDAKVMARLIAGIHGDRNLERTYLERFILPRRQS